MTNMSRIWAMIFCVAATQTPLLPSEPRGYTGRDFDPGMCFNHQSRPEDLNERATKAYDLEQY